MSATFTKAMVENNTVTLPLEEAERLLVSHKESDHFVATKFQGLYYTDEENDLIDTLRTNIAAIRDPYKHAIAMTALIRACTKKRPRGIFTYTGHRYDDGRKDLQKSLAEQFLDAVEAVNSAVFDNGNKPYEVRGFKLDSDFMPVSAAGGGKGDLYCEFDDFTILTEVTMSTSSRQEAMEGEPVRRHVSDAVLKYEKPVYGMFIAVRIDTNTAETFRHGIWYAKGDMKQRLDIAHSA